MRTISEKASDFLTKLLPFVENDGARNLNEISRKMPIPYQTLRKRVVSLNKKGFTIETIPDVEKLGLERIRTSFKVSNSLDGITSFFGGLHQSAGLRSYSRQLVRHSFDCEFCIPRGHATELEKLLGRLEEIGMIRDFDMKKIFWKDILMMKTQFFDYSKNSWDVDFTRLVGDPSSVQIPQKSNPGYYDYFDLLLLKDLEIDSWMKIVDLAKRADHGVPDTAYHLNKHVFGKNLIKSFRFRWVGTKESWMKHTIVPSTFVFSQISAEDATRAMSVLTSVPFTWSHDMSEDDTYSAEMWIPLPQFSETLQYVSKQLRHLDLAPEVLIKDWSCLSSFTIPYTLYNKDRSSWDFNAERSLEYTLQMIKNYP